MIYFLIPVFNEADNIPLLAENTLKALPDEEKHFVFVDDCSTDSTLDLIKKHYSGHRLQIITKEVNGGPGDSFNKGFEWIVNQPVSDSDLVVTLEGDNTSDIGILYNMITISRLGYDLVLASVYAQGGGFNKTSFIRKLTSVIANTTIRFIFDLKVLTQSSFYRVYSVPLLKKIKGVYGSFITENGFISMVEILLRAIRINASVIEVPMLLDSSKRKGKSKMKMVKTARSYLSFLLRDRKTSRKA